MLIKYRLLVFSLIISFIYIKSSFAGNESENPVPLKRILAPLGDCPKIPLFLENQDLQKDSPFFIIPKYVKALIFYHLDYKSTLNAMYVCKMFTNIIGMARNNLSHNWKNSPNKNTLIKHAFHPASMISLFDDISKGVPPRFINWQENKKLQDEEKHISEQASDLFELVKDSQKLKFLLIRYLLGLDPAIHFRQVSLGAYLIEKFPKLQEYLSYISQNKDLGDIGLLDSSFDPILKSHLMSLKLLALIGNSNSKTILKELLGQFRIQKFYFLENNLNPYKYESIKGSGSKLPPSWFCYLDNSPIIYYNRFIGLLTYEQGESFTSYFGEYEKNYFNKNINSTSCLDMLLLRFWYIFFNVKDNLTQVEAKFFSKLEYADFEQIDFLLINLMQTFTFKPSSFYSKMIQFYEKKLNHFGKREGDFIKTSIIILILTLGDEIYFEKAEKYIKDLLLKFGSNMKSINYDVNDGRIIHLAQIMDLKAILAIYKGNFIEAENFLRTGTYKDKKRFDFDTDIGDNGLISKFKRSQVNSYLRKEYSKDCLYNLALLKSLKTQIHHPHLSKKLIKSIINFLKCFYHHVNFVLLEEQFIWQISYIMDEEFIRKICKYHPIICSRYLKMLEIIHALTYKQNNRFYH